MLQHTRSSVHEETNTFMPLLILGPRTGVDVMRPAYNFQIKYKVAMLNIEQWTRGCRTHPTVKGLLWYADGFKILAGAGDEIYGQSLGRKVCIALEKSATVFQAQIYAILVCACEIQKNARAERYVSVCSDSQAALKGLQAVKTSSLLVKQCQKSLNDIYTQHSVVPFLVPEHSGARGNEIADGLTREGTVHQFFGPKPALGVSRQKTRKIF